MDRQEIKNKIIEYFRKQIELKNQRSDYKLSVQMSNVYELFRDSLKDIPMYQQNDFYSVVREIIQELINANFIYPGVPGDFNSGYPWLSITEYGKKVFVSENWLPYDPEGYLEALKQKVSEIDDVTFSYIGESVSAFNRRHLLAATITLGVASENLMLLLIEAYTKYLKNPRKDSFQKKVADRWIFTQYKEFKQEFLLDVKTIPKELQGDWETYLDGVFNFIRLNRNSAGHPTGKELSVKVIYANLQIFAEYACYVSNLMKFFNSNK